MLVSPETTLWSLLSFASRSVVNDVLKAVCGIVFVLLWFRTGIKWVAFPSKTMGKNHKSFWMRFFQKSHFWLFDVFWYFKLWKIPLVIYFCRLKLLMLLFHYKIDILEEYSLATNIATSYTCFKSQYYTRKSSFYLFSMVENPVKPCITKSRKNLDKQDKIGFEK